MAAINSRYARAFAEVIVDDQLDPVRTLDEVRTIEQLIADNHDLMRVWESPAIPAEEKRRLLDAIVARAGSSKMVRNFIAVLIDNHRLAALPQIAQQLQAELYQRLGIAEASVTSARELTPQEKAELQAHVAQLTGMQVRAQYSTDPNLLGGAVVRIGSTIYDGSVRGQLRRIKDQLSSA